MGKNAVDVFVGLGNYKELFRDKLFLGALKNTVVIVVVAVPTVCAFSLWVATAIYDMKPALTSAFRCIFYLPVVTGSGCGNGRLEMDVQQPLRRVQLSFQESRHH